MARSSAALGLFFGFGACLAIAPEVSAASLALTPSDTDLTVGEAFSITVDISGLGASVAPSVGSFDFNLGFDSSLVAVSGVVFGPTVPDLGSDFVDLSGNSRFFTSIGFGPYLGAGLTGADTLRLFEFSLDAPAALDVQQPDSFTLATIAFTTVGVGTADFDLSINTLGDALGFPLSVNGLPDASVDIEASEIPEPATLIGSLLALAAAAKGYQSRRATSTNTEK